MIAGMLCGIIAFVSRRSESVLGKLLPDQHDARIGQVRGYGKTKLAAHLQHRLVLPQNLANELTNASLPCNVDEPCHQQISETASFPIAANGDGVFGAQLVGVGKEMRHTKRTSV